MAELTQAHNAINVEAPDSVILGLLSVIRAEENRLTQSVPVTLSAAGGAWQLTAVQNGSLLLTDDKEPCALTTGQAAVIRPNSTVTLLPQEDTAITVLILQGEAANRLFNETILKGGSLFPAGGGSVTGTLRQLEAEAARSGQVSAARASALAFDLLTRLYGTGVPRQGVHRQLPRVVAEALTLLQRDFLYLSGISDLAERLNVSQEYLTRSFRAHVGTTPGQYLNRMRVERAKLLLRQPGTSVAFVSDACGFANSNYFARMFRSFVGMTPSRYAREMGRSDRPESLPEELYIL